MELNKHTASLRADLLAAAALGDEHTRQTAEALGAAAEASAKLMLMGALSEFAGELNEQLGDRSVHVRLDGADVFGEVRMSPTAADPTASDSSSPSEDYPTMDEVTGEMRRVTLRMVEHMKDRAEEAASTNGVSLNSWLSQAVQGALRDQIRKDRSGF
ncbi:hypothetical protein E5720_01605 [Rhodococcus sp. PAMC28707]|uniref:hypothetical protein n=1 Tax=unclassified Rhodococcus (in: high G+C Gram-positive bacteria) TaxID=192944 RepID=UPI00109DAB16|nr:MULTISPECIES: hypothetical protein [unclassified Rhodococcus (in: high G+C Gram-positive bacteria)]QCB50920.1 hypothetical protein E5769_12410 [Rhodococcus sp. PAMC28705]QCB57388.1 hypothetical protein E5720_01605 [Rhodococcus sp. PAMC28707]